MIVRYILIGILVIMLIVVGIFMVDILGPWDTYENPSVGLRIKYPKDWDVKQGVEGTLVTFLSPFEGDWDVFRENVNIDVRDLNEARHANLRLFSSSAIRQMKAMFPDIIILESSPIRVAFREGHRFVYLAENALPGLDLMSLYVWTISRRNAYILTYSADADSYEDFLETVEEMIESLSISIR